MSRVAKNPIQLPNGVEVKLDGSDLTVKGSMGSLGMSLGDGIKFSQEDNVVSFDYENASAAAMAGTTRALVNNMVKGVSEGWEKKLVLNGVGYRAKASGKSINLTVGLSHPVDFKLPEGVSVKMVRIFEMPCCRCLQTICTVDGKQTVVIFEHADEHSFEFGHRPSMTCQCAGRKTRSTDIHPAGRDYRRLVLIFPIELLSCQNSWRFNGGVLGWFPNLALDVLDGINSGFPIFWTFIPHS